MSRVSPSTRKARRCFTNALDLLPPSAAIADMTPDLQAGSTQSRMPSLRTFRSTAKIAF